MSEFVVDASVAAKWLFPEPHEEPARRLLDVEHQRLVPDLLYAEIANICWQRIRRGTASTDEVEQRLSALLDVPVQVHPSRALAPLALALAAAINQTAYDCMYLAVAVLRHCPLVTADRRFYDALGRTPLAAHRMWVEDVPEA